MSRYLICALSILISLSQLGAQKVKIGTVWRTTGIFEFTAEGNVEPTRFLKGTKVFVADNTGNGGKEIKFKGVPFLANNPPSKTTRNIKTLWVSRQNKSYDYQKDVYDDNEEIEGNTFKLTVDEFVLNFEAVPEINPNSYVKIGVLYQPYKIRPAWHTLANEWSYETDINLNAVFAFTPDPLRYNWFSFVLAPGVTSVTLNSDNSNFIADDEDVGDIKISAFTIGVGLLFSFSDVQVSVLMGADYLSKNKSLYNWDYHNVTWLSLGIGYNIFDLARDKSNSVNYN